MLRPRDFLVIGAMKSGTTSLYRDLSRQPGIYFPPGNKEPDALVDERVFQRLLGLDSPFWDLEAASRAHLRRSAALE